MTRAGWRLRRGAVVTVLVVCVLAVPLAGTGVATPAGDRTGQQTATADRAPGSIPELDIDADVITMEAAIAENGTAAWQVTYQMQLNDDADVDAFEQLQTEIETNPSAYLRPFEDRMNRTVSAAESATNREMTATGFEVVTERDSQPQSEFGLVTFQFQWQGFAATTGARIRAGDAVDSLFLDDGERLELRWPSEYARASTTPDPQTTRTGKVVWRGPIDFDGGEPRLELTTDGTQAAGGDRSTDGPGDRNGGARNTGSGVPVAPLVGAIGLALVAVATLVIRRREDEQTAPAESTSTGTTAQQTPPDELLSNEERVLRLLTQNGGRMKQKEVASQLDWTAAKTSQVVGDLRDEGEIEAFRLGRENVLTLPDVDIEGGDPDQQHDSGGEPA